jgi:hypothetical protein
VKGNGVKTLLLLGLAVAALSATAIAGSSSFGTPVISGQVSGRTELSSQQVQALSQWLEQHRTGWQGMITEASTEPTQLAVSLRHSDGAVTSISVVAQANGGHYLRLTGPGQWAYRSFGGIFKSWAAVRPLSDPELAELKTAVGASHPERGDSP